MQACAWLSGNLYDRSVRASRYLLLSAAVALAIVLLIFALRTYRELAEMQRIYLRDRASMVADRLETLSTLELRLPLIELLRRHEPDLADLILFEGTSPGDPAAVQAIRSGRELSRIQEVLENGRRIFRAWMPFHSAQRCTSPASTWNLPARIFCWRTRGATSWWRRSAVSACCCWRFGRS